MASLLHVGRAWAGGMSGSDVTERQSRKVHVARVFHVGGELGAEGMSGSDVTERQSREIHGARVFHVGRAWGRGHVWERRD